MRPVNHIYTIVPDCKLGKNKRGGLSMVIVPMMPSVMTYVGMR